MEQYLIDEQLRQQIVTLLLNAKIDAPLKEGIETINKLNKSKVVQEEKSKKK